MPWAQTRKNVELLDQLWSTALRPLFNFAVSISVMAIISADDTTAHGRFLYEDRACASCDKPHGFPVIVIPTANGGTLNLCLDCGSAISMILAGDLANLAEDLALADAIKLLRKA